MWQPGKEIKTRTDALQYAALRMLEEHRAMLDSAATIKSVSLDLRITPENLVRAGFLSPSFESGPMARPKIERFDFSDSPLLPEAPIVG